MLGTLECCSRIVLAIYCIPHPGEDVYYQYATGKQRARLDCMATLETDLIKLATRLDDDTDDDDDDDNNYNYNDNDNFNASRYGSDAPNHVRLLADYQGESKQAAGTNRR